GGETPAGAGRGSGRWGVPAIGGGGGGVGRVPLADPGGAAVRSAVRGQFLPLRLPVTAGAAPVLRSYSLSGPPAATRYRVSVKREPHGAGSQFVHARLRPGDLLEAAAPRGTFLLRSGRRPVLLISAGVGATPVLSMLHALAAA